VVSAIINREKPNAENFFGTALSYSRFLLSVWIQKNHHLKILIMVMRVNQRKNKKKSSNKAGNVKNANANLVKNLGIG
jgi:hypothetical protein